MSVRILLVDDESFFVESLALVLQDPTQGWQVKTASNGLEAIEVLEKEPIDVLVTDLNMPMVDGFGLIAELQQRRVGLPIIVMSANVPVDKTGLGSALSVLQKPVRVENLRGAISAALAGATRGELRGIGLASFLQLLNHERKTLSLRLSLNGLKGELHIVGGEFADAFVDELMGLEAAMLLCSWTEARIEVLPGFQLRERKIHERFEFVLMEAARRADERRSEVSFADVNEVSSPSPATAMPSPRPTPSVRPPQALVRASAPSAVGSVPTALPPLRPATISKPPFTPGPSMPTTVQPPPMPAPLPSPRSSILQKLVDVPGVLSAQLSVKGTNEVLLSKSMSKPALERAEYFERMMSLIGKELSLDKLFTLQVKGRRKGLLVQRGLVGSSICETDANIELQELSDSLDTEGQ